jgi:predicted ATP-grasp superfamily ATP-dependent carboligase
MGQIDVYVTDGFQRKTLAAVRALGSSGLSVMVGESTPLAPALYSKWARVRVFYPSAVFDPEGFIESLVQVLRRYRPKVLIPMEEETLLCILRCQDRIRNLVKLPFAPLEKFLLLRDKLWVTNLAGKIGIPVPHVFSYHEPLRFPVVLKPRIGAGSRGLKYCNSYQDLPGYRSQDYFVQERIPKEGEAICVSLLMDGVEPLAIFTHKRLREYPVGGGPSTLRISIREPQAEQMAIRLMRHVGWYGVASVEFKRDPRDGRLKLLEVNPRFWGSLNLAIKSGVNFPYLLYRMGVGERMDSKGYLIGVRSRWLFPGDILHLLSRLRSGSIPRGFFSLRGEHEDFRPLFGLASSLIPLIFKREFRRFIHRDGGS